MDLNNNPMAIGIGRFLVIALIICGGLTQPGSAVVNTVTALNVSNNSVMLSGYTIFPQMMWFTLSARSGVVPWNTTPVYVGGAFNYTVNITGYPLMPNRDWVFMACGNIDGCGLEKTFTTNKSRQITVPTYKEDYYDPMMAADWNFTKLSGVMQDIYGNAIGSSALFVGMIWFIFLGMMWIRSEDVIIPFAISALLSGVMFFDSTMIPTSWKPLLAFIMIMSLAGIGYKFWKGR